MEWILIITLYLGLGMVHTVSHKYTDKNACNKELKVWLDMKDDNVKVMCMSVKKGE